MFCVGLTHSAQWCIALQSRSNDSSNDSSTLQEFGEIDIGMLLNVDEIDISPAEVTNVGDLQVEHCRVNEPPDIEGLHPFCVCKWTRLCFAHCNCSLCYAPPLTLIDTTRLDFTLLDST